MSSEKKSRKKQISCKKCGSIINPTENPPIKTWQLISPMPDKDGRVTLTIMGSFKCQDCGSAVRASLKKIKGDEIGSGQSKRDSLIQAVKLIKNPTPIDQIEIAGVSPTAVGKAIQTLITQGYLNGNVENGIFHPEN